MRWSGPARPTTRRRGTRTAAGWAALSGAITADVATTFALDASDGLRVPGLALLAISAFAAETVLSARALRHVEAGVAYALFGLGTAIVAGISMTLLGEQASVTKVLALATIVAGVVLLGTANTSPAGRTASTTPSTGDASP